MSLLLAFIIQVAALNEPQEPTVGARHVVIFILSAALACAFLWRKPLYYGSVFAPPRYVFIARDAAVVIFADRQNPKVRLRLVWVAEIRRFVTPQEAGATWLLQIDDPLRDHLIGLVPPEDMAALVAMSIASTFKQDRTNG